MTQSKVIYAEVVHDTRIVEDIDETLTAYQEYIAEEEQFARGCRR